MKKVYESIDYSRVGHFQSILESSGIKTEIRNEGGSGVAGEVPFTQVYPELWVLSNADEKPAREIIAAYRRENPEQAPPPPWTCPGCGETVEGQFAECWNCSSPAPGAAG